MWCICGVCVYCTSGRVCVRMQAVIRVRALYIGVVGINTYDIIILFSVLHFLEES